MDCGRFKTDLFISPNNLGRASVPTSDFPFDRGEGRRGFKSSFHAAAAVTFTSDYYFFGTKVAAGLVKYTVINAVLIPIRKINVLNVIQSTI